MCMPEPDLMVTCVCFEQTQCFLCYFSVQEFVRSPSQAFKVETKGTKKP